MRNVLLFIALLLGLSLLSCSDSGTGPESSPDNQNSEEIPTYNVSVSMAPSDAGSLSLSDTTVDEGEEIELQANPNNGYMFTEWSGDIESTDNPHSLTVDQDYDITANFGIKSYELAIAKEGEGTVNEEVLEQKSKDYEHGTVVELTANPAEGYKFVEWRGDVTGTDNPAQVTVDNPKEVTAVFEKHSINDVRVGYLKPNDFVNDKLTITLPESNSGESYIITVPNLNSSDYFQRNSFLNNELITFDATVETTSSSPLDLRPLPDKPNLTLNTWEQPVDAEPAVLEKEKTFHVWSQIDEAYVAAEGKLAYEGELFAFYEDVTNNENFSESDYSEMNDLMETYYPDLTENMGEPTDLDGNDRLIVFISRTLMDIRNYGQAYVDGCHMRAEAGGCQERGEFLYIMSLDNFSNSSNNRDYYVKNYYPRNILHEMAHILQQAHWYRLEMPNEGSFIPAFYREGQAELIPFSTPEFREDEVWDSLKNRFSSSNQEKLSPWFYPYDLGALFFSYMYQTFGEGYSQELIDASYNSDKRNTSLTELTVGIKEPLVLALMYGSLLMDGTELGKNFGLEFPDEDIQTRLAGTSLPIIEMSVNDSVQEQRGYTGYAMYKVTHNETVNFQLTSNPESAYVLVIQQ